MSPAPALTLTLVARILPPLFAVAIGVYATWCQAIAFVGGTIPLIGWHLEGGVLTGVLWAFLASGFISWSARLVLRSLLAVIGKVIPMTVSTTAALSQPAASSSHEDAEVVPPSPDGAADGYHPGFASLCAVASQLVYQPDEQVKQLLGPLQASGLSIIVEHNHRCLLLVYADCIVVAFRGTDAGELADWKTNLQHTPTSGPFGLVHSGYLAAVDLLWPRLTASLQRMRENNQTLLLTGHSMGGALAVVAAAKFAAEGILPLAGLYTFGQPAVAEAAFETELASRIAGRYFRFVNSIDMVPTIHVDVAFKAGGQQFFIDRGGRIHTGDLMTRMMSTHLLTSVLEPEARRAEIEDHGIAEYVRALAAAATERPGSRAHGLTQRETIHHWISVVLFAAVFVAMCVLFWNAHGAQAFAMGMGALYTLAILAGMLVWPREYNDHLLHWYTRQGLART
jgi:triacylglycerol lipase